MPNTVAGYGRGGGIPAAPAGSQGGDNDTALSTLVSANPRPMSLFPGMVLTGVVNAFGNSTVLGAIPIAGQKTPLGWFPPLPTDNSFVRVTEGT